MELASTFRAECSRPSLWARRVLVIQPTIFADEHLTIPHVVSCSTLETDWGSRRRLLNCINIRFRVVYSYSLWELQNGITEGIPLEWENYDDRCSQFSQVWRLETFADFLQQEGGLRHWPVGGGAESLFSDITDSLKKRLNRFSIVLAKSFVDLHSSVVSRVWWMHYRRNQL